MAVLSTALTVALVGCHGRVPERPPVNLAGVQLPLRDGPVVAAVVDGAVGTVPAEIALEVAAPLSSVTLGCYPTGALPETRASVTVRLPLGGEKTYTESELTGVRLGSVALGPLGAAVIPGKSCLVTLGSEVLKPYALEIDPEARTLKLAASRSRAQYEAMLPMLARSEEAGLVELTLEPKSDWPLLTVRAGQGHAALVGTFVLSTARTQSAVTEPDAHRAGLRTEQEELEATFPPNVHLPLDRLQVAFSPDALELSPTLTLAHARLLAVAGQTTGLVGMLGADVWSKFHVTIDPRAGVMLLSRAAVQASGSVQRCSEGAHWSEEACFDIRSHHRDHGLFTTVSLRRAFPEGGRVYLQPLTDGKPSGAGCRVGVTVPPSDRGTTVAEALPWKALEDAQPLCAEALAQATELGFALYEDGPLPGCPGVCMFVTQLGNERTSCACQPGTVTAQAVAEQRFRPLLERFRKGAPPSTPPPEEPDEPDVE